MEDENKGEDFNSTEIKIDQIETSDKSDEWDVVSEFEVDTYPTPYISVPRMREVEEESIDGACKTSTSCDVHDKRGISSQLLQDLENMRIQWEMTEAMWDTPEEEARQSAERSKQTQEAVRKADSMYNEFMERERERERVSREMEEAMQEIPPQDLQKQVNKRIVTGMEEAKQERSPRNEQELGKESLPRREQYSKTKSEIESPSEKNETTKQFKLPMKCPEATLKEQSKEVINQGINDALQTNTVTSSAALLSKSQDRTAESESISKVKGNECQFFQRGDSRAFEELCKLEASNKAAKVDKLEKDSQVKICSKYSVSFRNEKCDSSSSKENDEKNDSSKIDEASNESRKNEEEKN